MIVLIFKVLLVVCVVYGVEVGCWGWNDELFLCESDCVFYLLVFDWLLFWGWVMLVELVWGIFVESDNFCVNLLLCYCCGLFEGLIVWLCE